VNGTLLSIAGQYTESITCHSGIPLIFQDVPIRIKEELGVRFE
jgi:hypothetical protein